MKTVCILTGLILASWLSISPASDDQSHRILGAGIQSVSSERLSQLLELQGESAVPGKEAGQVTALSVWVSHTELGEPSSLFHSGDAIFVNAAFTSGGGPTAVFSAVFAVYPPVGLRGSIAPASGFFPAGPPLVSSAAWRIPDIPHCLADVAVVLVRDNGGESYAFSAPFRECP